MTCSMRFCVHDWMVVSVDVHVLAILSDFSEVFSMRPERFEEEEVGRPTLKS
jgi:hypothetical protein